MPTVTYPHTMTRGRFRGQTFATQRDYQNACKAKRSWKSRSRAQATTSGSDVRKIVGLYELLVAEGIGKAKTIKMIEAMLQS